MQIKPSKTIKLNRIFPLSNSLILLFSIFSMAQNAQLSLVDIFTALRSDKATMDVKNQILARGVMERGVTFSLNETLQKELENAGAEKILIEAIILKNPAKVPTVEAKPEPTPQPTPEAPPEPKSIPKEQDFTYFQNKGNNSYIIGNYASAIKHFTKAIELNDQESTIFLSRGLANFKQKNYKASVEDFTNVIKLDLEESMAFFTRGKALEKIGKLNEALKDYKKASELDNEDAKIAFEKLQAELKPKPIEKPILNIEENVDKTEKVELKSTPPVEAEKKELPKLSPPTNIANLQKLAKRLVTPMYPAFEREVGISGIVTVKVTIDEEGKVLEAKAINGPSGLRKQSEIAAQRSKFKPYVLNGVPTKASGFINYSFKR